MNHMLLCPLRSTLFLLLSTVVCSGLTVVPAQAQTTDEPRCNVGQSKVRISTFLAGPSASGIESMIEVDGKSAGRTDPMGSCRLDVDPCSSAEHIEARPTTINYCPEIRDCAKELSIEIFRGCSPVSTVLSGGATHVPWYRELTAALDGSIPSRVETAEIAAASQAALDAYDQADFVNAAFRARDLTNLLIEAEQPDLAWAASALQLDAAFRAVGIEPASPTAPLLQRFENGHVLPTELGMLALVLIDQNLKPEAISLTADNQVPIVLQNDAFDILSAAAAEGRTILHPDLVGDFAAYILRKS